MDTIKSPLTYNLIVCMIHSRNIIKVKNLPPTAPFTTATNRTGINNNIMVCLLSYNIKNESYNGYFRSTKKFVSQKKDVCKLYVLCPNTSGLEKITLPKHFSLTMLLRRG